MRYLEYQKRIIVTQSLLGAIVWMALTTFVILAKSSIGIKNIPIFELLIFVASIVSSKIAYTKLLSFSNAVKIDLIIESLFLISIYIILIKYNSLIYSGLAIYAIIIINSMLNVIKNERARDYEDLHLRKYTHKKFLKVIRLRDRNYQIIGGLLGTSIALITLNYIEIDIIDFALIMLILNVVQNVYEYYITYKYL